jgi:tetratricopeptide (TPR) repeat protein
LDQEAAHRTFIDIADNGHSPEEVNEVLSLTDNMPLVISLLAHLVDAEGCSAVLSRWAEEKTSLISDGFDKRSNLDLSISLSLSSPRIEYLPHSQDLLSLLSMLPDGLSETELMQSKLPINNILGCKAALIRTALAYNDEHKQLKMLGPIREYMQKMKPPGYHLIHPLLKHFQELLEFYVENHGAQLGSSIVGRISSNLANIQSVLQKGLQPGHADLKDTIYCMCHLNQISRHIGCKGPIALIAQVHGMLPQLRDPHLEAYFITELLASWRYYPISNHKTLVSDSLKNVEQVDDTDLKCMLALKSFLRANIHFSGRFYSRIADYYQIHMQDLSTAIHFSQMVVSLGISSGNTKWQSQGLYDLAKHTWFLGDYSACKVYAHESQKLARISADLFREALALHFEAICLYTLGDYQQSTPLFDRARVLVELCGVSGGALDRNIMSDQAEVYKLKSEYIEARNIHTGLLQVTPLGQDPYKHAFALLNIAEIDVLVGAPAQNAQTNIQTARELFHARGLGMEVTYCEAILADLCLREGDIQVAGSLLEKCIKSRPQPTIMSYCLERLGDVNRWNISHHASSWTILYLVYSLKCKEKLGIHKALQFLGDMFHAYEDAETAISLYRVALEGFTAMDIHRSRAECMLRLGDISKGHSDLLKSVELWETARPLFERSSQTKQIESIDERLAGVRANILEQHHRNFTRLAEINAPSGTVDRLKDDLSDVDELEETGLDEARAVDPDAV